MTEMQKPEPNNLMLSAVIRMPFEMAMADPISRMQFYQRAQQALNELETLQSQDLEDAERYRWLRENADSVRGEYTEEIFYRMDVRTGVSWASATIHNAPLPSIDAVIDAARKEQS